MSLTRNVVALVSAGAIALAPSRADAQSWSAWPSTTEHGTIAFEDLWPALGDGDFNDLAMRVHVTREEDVNGHTTGLVYSFNVWALGADKCGGLGLRLAGEAPANLTVERVIGTAGEIDGRPWAASPTSVVTDGAGGAVIPVTPDVRGEICGGANGFLNTVDGSPTVSCAPVGLRITFANPSPTAIDAPGDLFWFGCGSPGTQVHRSIYPPIPAGPYAANPALLGTADDASETGPGADRFYVTASGVPFALSFADGIVNLPAEREPITTVLPQILDFAANQGGLDFWHHPAGGHFVFAQTPPPLPFAEFEPLTETEQDLCDADPFGIWVGTPAPGACDCHLGGPSWAWDGTACFDDEAGLCADWGGTWAAGDCTCPYGLTWSGASCYDATDERALACVNGSTSTYSSTHFEGGGTWENDTCDCSAKGVGWYWNGFGCVAPSGVTDPLVSPAGNLEAQCWAAGGTWDPTRVYAPVWQGQSGGGSGAQSACDCSAFGPGYVFDNVACTDMSEPDGTAALCEQSGGYWAWWGNYCECGTAGYGAWWDATSGCITGTTEYPGPEDVCVEAGGIWTGTHCDCSATGPGVVWDGSQCVGGAEYYCTNEYSGGAGWNPLLQTCDCSPWGGYWDTATFQCLDLAMSQDHCGQSGGTWVGSASKGTCDCEANGPGAVWDGNWCSAASASPGCETDGGTYRTRAPWNPENQTPAQCDCPAGEAFDWALYQCVPYDEFECRLRHGGTYDAALDRCQCGSGLVPFGVWDGATCVRSVEREACEADGGWWDAATDTCQCNDPRVWNPERLACDDPTGERDCQRAGGVWTGYPDPTCGCAGWYEAWDPVAKACVYSPERHGCEEDARPWNYGGDPDSPSEYGCQCENWYRPGVSTTAEDWDWDEGRIECVDISGGEVSCEADHNGTWDEFELTCNCQYSPVSWSRWNALLEECVYDPEVEACSSGVGPYWSSWWNPATETCTCYGPDAYAEWSWNGTTGECVGPEKEACDAHPIGVWEPSWQTCGCGSSATQAWSYDHGTGTGTCTNPEYDDCVADPNGVWNAEGYGAACSCDDLGSWSWTWDGIDGFGACTDGSTGEWACLSSQPPGTWYGSGGPGGLGYCDCDASTERRWNGGGCSFDWAVQYCEADPHGWWDYTTDACDCSADDPAAWFNGSECTTPLEEACEAQGATWEADSDTCTCPVDYTWNPGTQTCDDDLQIACDADPIGYWAAGYCYCGAQGSWSGGPEGGCVNAEYDACSAALEWWDESTATCQCASDPQRPSWIYDQTLVAGACTESGSYTELYCVLDASGEWNDAYDYCACTGAGERWDGMSCSWDQTVDDCQTDWSGASYWDYQIGACDCTGTPTPSTWDGWSCRPDYCSGTWYGDTAWCSCDGGGEWNGDVCF